MKFLSHIKDWLYLSKSESKVIIFLISVLVIGIAIDFFKNNFLKDELPAFTNKQYDSLFNIRAKEYSELSEKNIDGEELKIKININKADKKELMQLPGIGEEMAERILIFRKDFGDFKTKQDLKKIKGIGNKKFEKLSKFVILK